jgi:sortase A
MTTRDDSLTLGQIVPGQVHTPHGQHQDKNPVVADDARAKIAALTSTAAEPLAPVQTPQPHTQPSSPALAHHQTHRTKHPAEKHAKPILSALGTFLLLLALFKAPVIFSQVGYIFSPPKADIPTPTAPVTQATNTVPTLMIPKINVSAPLIFESSTNDARIDKALESGVVHYGPTPAPGQPGNSVIVGHSSNDWWEAGGYKFVFVLLDKLVPGDTMTIDYQGTRYIYEVTVGKVVAANDLSVLSPTPTPSITLITCWPVGTNLKRWVIQAKQVSPKPTGVAQTPTTAPTSGNTLPGNAESFTEQIKDFWQVLGGVVTNEPTTVVPPSGEQSGSLPGGL